LTEWELIEQLKLKNNEAFKIVVDTWQDMVYNTVLSIVQNAEDAEDVSQEVFIQVYESIKNFKGDSKFFTWIYRIVVSKSLDHLRKRKRKKRFAFIQSLFGEIEGLIHDPPDFFHPGIALENKENAAELFKAITALPQNQNIAFLLNKVEGLTYQQISEVMKISEAAVDSLLHRAKKNLRKNLESYYRYNK